MATTKQDSQFKDFIADNVIAASLPSSTLDDVLDWIRDNLEPDDVFTEKDLDRWAESNDYKKD